MEEANKMCEALLDLMKDELDERERAGRIGGKYFRINEGNKIKEGIPM